MKILVIGGTGLIGSQVVKLLEQQGHQAVAAAPSTGVDTVTGEGLAHAMAGAEVVIDVSNSPSFEEGPAMEFFEAAGGNITTAEIEADVSHHVALSVVGTDRLQDSGYFRAKQAQEEQIRRSPIPYTLVHATQFFEFLRGIAASATEGETVRLPNALFQPMAARDVAAEVADAALAAPVNGTIEIAGPESVRMDTIVGRVLEHDKDPRRVVSDPHALYFGLELDDKSLMPGPDARVGATSFEWWIANVPPPSGK